MTEKELMEMKERIELMVKEEAYLVKGFPLSCGGLRFLQATIMFSFWVRKGKGVKIVEGEVVVCELKESPFWERYQQPEYKMDEGTGELYDPDSPEHERDQTMKEEEERGEFV
jgi:hypothetical protein